MKLQNEQKTFIPLSSDTLKSIYFNMEHLRLFDFLDKKAVRPDFKTHSDNFDSMTASLLQSVPEDIQDDFENLIDDLMNENCNKAENYFIEGFKRVFNEPILERCDRLSSQIDPSERTDDINILKAGFADFLLKYHAENGVDALNEGKFWKDDARRLMKSQGITKEAILYYNGMIQFHNLILRQTAEEHFVKGYLLAESIVTQAIETTPVIFA